jgi:hypothetical protein
MPGASADVRFEGRSGLGLGDGVKSLPAIFHNRHSANAAAARDTATGPIRRHVTAMRMTASVGSTIFGISRSSKRTSRGP